MLRSAAGLPPTFWWLFAGQGVMALATFVFPFLALFLRSRGFGPAEAGLVVALFGAGSILAGPVSGALTDRLGRRPTLVGALVATAALTALLPAARAPGAVAACVLALGVAAHLYWPAANAVVADVLPPSRYEDGYGLLYWQRNAGIAVSFAAGGALAARGYGLLFVADALTTFLFAAVALWRIPETRPQPSRVGGDARGLRAALADRHLLRLLVLNVAFLVVMFQFMTALPVHMASRGLGPDRYGPVMAVNGVLILLLQPLAGRVTRDRDEGGVLAIAALLAAAGYGAYALCATAWQFAVATGIWSLGEILAVPVLSGLASRLAPPDLRGRYQGLLSLSFGAGLTLAPAIGGAALGALGPRIHWAAMAALGAAASLGHLEAGRARRRAAARAAA